MKPKNDPQQAYKAKVLIVDDEESLRIGLMDLLGLMGYQVEGAASGIEALMVLERTSFDLMVLDLCMPGMSGDEVMEQSAQGYPDLPIIILTANPSVETAISAVKSSNVADYMLKPFDIQDLAAVISRVIKERAEQIRRRQLLDTIDNALHLLRDDEERESVAASPSLPLNGEPVAPLQLTGIPQSPDRKAERFLRVGTITLDRQKRLTVTQHAPGEPIELTENEVAILASLMKHANQVLSCVELAEAAVGCQLDRLEAQNVVRPTIYRLRQKIEPKPKSPQFIRTVRGRGYFFSPNTG